MKTLIIEAPAKINLTLDIKSRRADGYHELETVMHQINLIDRIILQKAGQGINISCNCEDIPQNEENLAYKAAEIFMRELQREEDVNIIIEKNIPPEAGLAGGSTDAAAVLLGLNRLYDYGVEEQRLMDMGAFIGSDIPFCLMGNHNMVCINRKGENSCESSGPEDGGIKRGATALGRGRGEILTELNPGFFDYIVLVKPDFNLSTREVYKDFNFSQISEKPDTKTFLQAWDNRDITAVAAAMGNALESVSIKKCPEIMDIKKRLNDCGALNAIMSGSGPSVFGVFREGKKAYKAVEILKQRYNKVYLVSSYGRSDDNAGKKTFTGQS